MIRDRETHRYQKSEVANTHTTAIQETLHHLALKLFPNIPESAGTKMILQGLDLATDPLTGIVVPQQYIGKPELLFPAKLMRDHRLMETCLALNYDGEQKLDPENISGRGRSFDLFMEIIRYAKKTVWTEPQPSLMLTQVELLHPQATSQEMSRIPGFKVITNGNSVQIIYQSGGGRTYWFEMNESGIVGGYSLQGTFRMLPDQPKHWMYSPDVDHNWRTVPEAQISHLLEQLFFLVRAESNVYTKVGSNPSHFFTPEDLEKRAPEDLPTQQAISYAKLKGRLNARGDN